MLSEVYLSCDLYYNRLLVIADINAHSKSNFNNRTFLKPEKQCLLFIGNTVLCYNMTSTGSFMVGIVVPVNRNTDVTFRK